MWLAGPDRLLRYDGSEVREYPRGPQNPNSPTSFTRSMIVGRDGKLWLARDRGVGLAGPFGSFDEFDPVAESFHPYQPPPAELKTPIGHVLQDRSGLLWLSTNDGLFRMDPATGAFQRYGGLSAPGVRATLEARDGTFWVATTRGVDLLDRAASRVVEHYAFTRDFSTIVPFSVKVLLWEDSEGSVWASSPDGLARLDRKNGKFVRYLLDAGDHGRYSVPTAVYADRDGAFWIASSTGLLMLDRERRRLIRYRNNLADPESISGNAVQAIY
jgi:ligand-binding sensor domain-containing protein